MRQTFSRQVHGKLNKIMKAQDDSSCGRGDCNLCTRIIEGNIFSFDGSQSYEEKIHRDVQPRMSFMGYTAVDVQIFYIWE